MKRETKPIYAVIGDGPTESLYFESIRDCYRSELKGCTLKPLLPKHATVSELESLIKRCRDYDKVLCIIDMDTKLKDQAEMSKYRTLKERCAKELSCVYFFETLPCTELWFYYYFDFSAANHLKSYEPHLEKMIKSKIPNYDKKMPFCQHSHIVKCGGKFDKALHHGDQSIKDKDRMGAYSEMSCFFREIGLVP